MIDLTVPSVEWPLSFKIRRGVWIYILQPLGFFLPKRFSFLRVAMLRLMGATIGRKCLIMPKVRVLMPWNLNLADYVAIGEGVDLYNFALVRIGEMSVVSQGVYLCTGSHDYTKAGMPLVSRPIEIGRDCWIAAEAFISPGVVVEDGVVVGARSVVVTKRLAAWAVYGGNPAKYIKPRIVEVGE